MTGANSLGIVIGIDDYGASRSSLKGPVADAIDLAEWLVASGLPPDRLHLGLSRRAGSPPLPDSLAPCEQFVPTLDKLQALLDGFFPPDAGPLPAPFDRLWFFFSGHGASSTSPYYTENAICLTGFTFGKWMFSLEISSLRQALTSIPAVERYLLIDGCRDHVVVGAPRFGQLSLPNRPPGARANYELLATAEGRKAIERRAAPDQTVRGLFSRHLVDGLRGTGRAKRWLADDGSGVDRYVVRWSTLKTYVSSKVAADTGVDPASQQLVMAGGEAPATEDPVLAWLDPATMPTTKLTVQLASPATPPFGMKLVARRVWSLDPDIEVSFTASQTDLLLPPSSWLLTARANNWRPRPKALPLDAYDETLTARIDLDADEQMPLPRAQLEAVAPLQLPASSNDAGELAVSLAGQPLTCVRPAPIVSLWQEGGVPMPVGKSPCIVAPGVYRLRVETAAGAAAESMVVIEAGQTAKIDLSPLSETTPGLAAAMSLCKKPVDHGRIMPSESLGWLTGGSLATMVSIAVGQAAQGFRGELAALNIDDDWPADGVQIVIADESSRDGIVSPRSLLPCARLWRMFLTNDGIYQQMRQGSPTDVLMSARLSATAGGYWLQLLAPDKGPNGFKMATLVRPGHRTLVLRHMSAAGSVALLQFNIPVESGDYKWDARQRVTGGLVEAEAVQRALLRGCDPVAIPGISGLVGGNWFEPFTSWAVAARLLDRDDDAAVALLAKLVDSGVIDGVEGAVEAAIIHGVRAQRAGDTANAVENFRAAVALQRVPIIDRLLEPLVTGMARNGLEGEVPDWIREKARQVVDHPLWTLRRPDDKRLCA